ncbi:DUF3626 domain-containing protein [Nocardia sp. NPDC005366]|uniref:DUF3626 domain-containing protein n=1 Tax=Nocardia sp. NPDC005366 TaxID=3156878 RepID=UPI0033BBF7D0
MKGFAGKTPAAVAISHVERFALGSPLPRSARVNLHFHPDMPVGTRTTLEAIAAEGVYRSQFETGTGNGGLTAYPGGDRWRWESRIFGGAYDDSAPAHRPKYGSLNYRADPYGSSPRFGSSYFVVNEATLRRTTFCYPDSFFEPVSFGTARAMDLIRLARESVVDDPLDAYIEAHVHGPVDIATDVEALVLDRSYRGTPIEDAAADLACPVRWHPGFVVDMDKVAQHSGYRGEYIVEVARAVADRDVLNARILGVARGAGFEPGELKKVWHYLARYGRG